MKRVFLFAAFALAAAASQAQDLYQDFYRSVSYPGPYLYGEVGGGFRVGLIEYLGQPLLNHEVRAWETTLAGAPYIYDTIFGTEPTGFSSRIWWNFRNTSISPLARPLPPMTAVFQTHDRITATEITLQGKKTIRVTCYGVTAALGNGSLVFQTYGPGGWSTVYSSTFASATSGSPLSDTRSVDFTSPTICRWSIIKNAGTSVDAALRVNIQTL